MFVRRPNTEESWALNPAVCYVSMNHWVDLRHMNDMHIQLKESQGRKCGVKGELIPGVFPSLGGVH